MLTYDEFLPTLDPTRRKLYELFNVACEFVARLNPASRIVSVQLGDPGYANGGRISIPVNPENLGVVFHEVGHALLAQSVFHSCHLASNKAGNEKWGEAFSEAIRWLLESQYLKGSKWLNEFDREKNTVASDKCRADLILKKASYSLAGLEALWGRLVAGFDERPDYLDRQLT